MKLIAFTGMPFSGKSEAVNIARKMEIPVVRMGDSVWTEVKRRGFDLTDEHVGRVANKMRNDHGMDIWAKRTIDRIAKMDLEDLLVIDGIRNMEEIDCFKQRFGKDFILIAIVASDRIRHQRAISRNRVDDSQDIDDIKRRDDRETSWGITTVINHADKRVVNESSIESFHENIKQVLESAQH